MISNPSTLRQIATGVLMASAGGYAALVKLSRNGSEAFAPEWLAGVLPNLVCGAALPLAAFLSPRVIRPADFALLLLFTLAGLGLYEMLQCRSGCPGGRSTGTRCGRREPVPPPED